MKRTVLVGDVHGCLDELSRLLDRVAFSAGDRLVFVGDLVARGPDTRGVVSLARALGALAVRGNHEDKVLSRRHRAPADLSGTNLHDVAARELEDDDWAFLAALPLWLDLPEHGVRVLHAGLVPGVPIERQDPHHLMYMRGVGLCGEPLEKGARVPWAQLYAEAPHVVYGHNARGTPLIHAWSTGLDTGAVYGRSLTAMVLRAGEAPPPLARRGDVLVSVPARRAYSPG